MQLEYPPLHKCNGSCQKSGEFVVRQRIIVQRCTSFVSHFSDNRHIFEPVITMLLVLMMWKESDLHTIGINYLAIVHLN